MPLCSPLRPPAMCNRFMPCSQHELLNRLSESLIVVRRGNVCGGLLHVRAGLTHYDVLWLNAVMLARQLSDMAFICFRVSNVEVIRLREGCRDAVPSHLLQFFFAALSQFDLVGHSNEFHCLVDKGFEVVDNRGRKLYGVLLPGNVRSLCVSHEPVDVGVQEHRQTMLNQELQHKTGRVGSNQAHAEGLQTGCDNYAAVEPADWFGQLERLNQHLRAPRWAPAGNHKLYPGFAKLLNRIN